MQVGSVLGRVWIRFRGLCFALGVKGGTPELRPGLGFRLGLGLGLGLGAISGDQLLGGPVWGLGIWVGLPAGDARQDQFLEGGP